MTDPLDLEHFEGNVIDVIAELAERLTALEAVTFGNYRGAKSTDFTLFDLPNPGDYGYQTTDDEVQINGGGEIRAIATAAL